MASSSAHYLFLRAVNVGKRRVPMDLLREHFSRAGLGTVTTHLQTGNVMLENCPVPVQRLESTCETILAEQFGFPVPVDVRTAAELSHIVLESGPVVPLDSADSLYVPFFRNSHSHC